MGRRGWILGRGHGGDVESTQMVQGCKPCTLQDQGIDGMASVLRCSGGCSTLPTTLHPTRGSPYPSYLNSTALRRASNLTRISLVSCLGQTNPALQQAKPKMGSRGPGQAREGAEKGRIPWTGLRGCRKGENRRQGMGSIHLFHKAEDRMLRALMTYE